MKIIIALLSIALLSSGLFYCLIFWADHLPDQPKEEIMDIEKAKKIVKEANAVILQAKQEIAALAESSSLSILLIDSSVNYDCSGEMAVIR